jgi:hypothetical protein
VHRRRDLPVTKLGIELNFAKPASDAIQLRALVSVPDGYSPTGDQVTVDVGGVARSFVLDEKGKAQTETETVKLTVEKTGGVVLAHDAKLVVNSNKRLLRTCSWTRGSRTRPSRTFRSRSTSSSTPPQSPARSGSR